MPLDLSDAEKAALIALLSATKNEKDRLGARARAGQFV